MSYNLDKDSAKILVLGDSGVGKSSLIHLICHSAVLSSAQWTIGCSIDVKLHDNYFLEFWDIGGSRSHKIARAFLYQDYHGIILVFDGTNNKSRLNLNEWLMEVNQKTNDRQDLDVPTITIATKKDLLPRGSVLDLDDSPNIYTNEHSSVVDFNEIPQQQQLHHQQSNNPYRRHQVSSSPLFSSIQSLSSHSTTDMPSPDVSRPLLGNQVIYVNTQDALSFNFGSKNCERLDKFFKLVIDRRNKKVVNKFAI